MQKLPVLYGHPKDPANFRDYYIARHAPLAAKMPAIRNPRYTFEISARGRVRALFLDL